MARECRRAERFSELCDICGIIIHNSFNVSTWKTYLWIGPQQEVPPDWPGPARSFFLFNGRFSRCSSLFPDTFGVYWCPFRKLCLIQSELTCCCPQRLYVPEPPSLTANQSLEQLGTLKRSGIQLNLSCSSLTAWGPFRFSTELQLLCRQLNLFTPIN